MMTKAEYERLATYLSLHTPDDEAPAQMREHTRVLELEARITELEAALEWYGDTLNYPIEYVQTTEDLKRLPQIYLDRGKVARKALGR